MKRLAILTSILALAACGGGGGSYAPVTPENPDIVVPGENNGGTNQPDNGETTPGNGDSNNNPSTPVLSPTESNAIVTAFGPDVDLTQIEFSEEIGASPSFVLDNSGKIAEIKAFNNGWQSYKRIGDTNNFDSYEYLYEFDTNRWFHFYSTDGKLSIDQVKAGFQEDALSLCGQVCEMSDDEFNQYLDTLSETEKDIAQSNRDAFNKINTITSADEYEVDKETISMTSYGKIANLSFADFGIVRTQYDEDAWPRGYYAVIPDNKINIETQTIANNITFTGKAVGGLAVMGPEEGGMELNGDATLVLDTSKNATLTAEFNNWYDITVDKVGTSSSTISFDDKGREIDSKFTISDSAEKISTLDTSIQYLGENDTISEAVGGIDYGYIESGTGKMLQADIAFGVKSN